MSRDDDNAGPSNIDVVICAYTEDRFDDLNRAVESALVQVPPPSQVVVVVDQNDALLARLIDRNDIHVVANRYAKGLSGARNTGVEEARAEVVAFLDDDAAARSGWLAGIAEVMADTTVAGVGTTVVPSWDTGRPSWFPTEFDWVVGGTHSGMPTSPSPIRNPVGASMAFRTDALLEAGGFDISLGRVGTRPVGCEETELSIKVRRAHGLDSIRMAPGSVVDHRVPESRSNVGYFVRRCWAEGRSKAVVARRTTDNEGLESERSYVVSTLPRGVMMGLLRPPAGWGRACAIIVGTAVTTVGFVVGRLQRTDSVTEPEPNPLSVGQEAA